MIAVKNGGRFRDINKTSAIAGIVLLVVLLIGLLAAIIVVSIHTNAYIEYEEMHIKEIKVDEGISSSCPNAIIKKAHDAASVMKISVDQKEVEFSNIDGKGDYIILDFDDEGNYYKTYTSTENVVTFSNIKENMDIEITNDYDKGIIYISSDSSRNITGHIDGDTKDFEYEVKEGTYSFVAVNQHKNINYSVFVYYTEGDCRKFLARKVSVETPRHNILHDMPVCEGKENLPDCKEFVGSEHSLSQDNYDLSKILENIDKTDARKYKERSLANNKLALIIVSLIVIVLLVVAIVVVVIGVKKVRRGGVLHENEIDYETDEDKSETFEEYAREEHEKKNKDNNK